MNTTKTTRRQLLAQIPAVAVAGGAVMTTTAAVPIGADPDAELIALGEEATALYERRFELDNLTASYDAEHSERLYEGCRQISELQRRGEVKAAHDLAGTLDKEEKRLRPRYVEAAHEVADRITVALAAPQHRMFMLPARGLAGLAVKARLAAYEHDQLWAVPFSDLDWDKQFVRNLIDEVLALAGEPPPFEAPNA